MNSKVIFLKEAIKILSLKDKEGKPFPFDLRYRTFNSQTKQGGKIKEFIGAVYLPDANENSKPSLAPEAVFAREKTSRNPSHFDNRTKNIELPSGEIKKIRIDFIIEINGNKVIY